jgi:hypothetical protein
MQTYFIISLCVAIFGLLGAFINMGIAVKRGLGDNNMIAHLAFGACWAVGGIGSIVFGLIWAINHFWPNA